MKTVLNPLMKTPLPATMVIFATLVILVIFNRRAEAWGGSYVGSYTSINFRQDRRIINVNMLDVHPPGPNVEAMYEIAFLMRPGESYKTNNIPSSPNVKCNLGMQQMENWENGFHRYILVVLTQNIGVDDGSNCTYVIESSMGRKVAVRYRKEGL